MMKASSHCRSWRSRDIFLKANLHDEHENRGCRDGPTKSYKTIRLALSTCPVYIGECRLGEMYGRRVHQHNVLVAIAKRTRPLKTSAWTVSYDSDGRRLVMITNWNQARDWMVTSGCNHLKWHKGIRSCVCLCLYLVAKPDQISSFLSKKLAKYSHEEISSRNFEPW